MKHINYPVMMEIAGPTAMWARPDTGGTPVSYPAPTYSAVKGIFESILWGPAVEIVPYKVEICAPIQYKEYGTNYMGPLRKAEQIKKGSAFQLHATVLKDVCYRLYAYACPAQNKERLPESAKRWDRLTTSPGHAYQSIFNRRIENSCSYGGVFLGWREFTPSYFGKFREETKVCSEIPDIYIPSMLRMVFGDGYKTEVKPIYDTNLTIHKGILVYPLRRQIA